MFERLAILRTGAPSLRDLEHRAILRHEIRLEYSVTMRLRLPFPADWSVERHEAYERVVVPGHRTEPDLLVYVSELRGLPPVADASFFARELELEAPRGTRVSIEGVREDRSSTGWPVTIVRASVHRDGTLIEQRLASFYRVLDMFSMVAVVGRNPERWNEKVKGLGEIVLAAELDWSGPPACLAEILGLGPDNPVFKR
jgi:hypothetical protein